MIKVMSGTTPYPYFKLIVFWLKGKIKDCKLEMPKIKKNSLKYSAIQNRKNGFDNKLPLMILEQPWRLNCFSHWPEIIVTS